ncbi:hypothetical protein NPIL_508671, partial [Nephila pilipes]
TMIVDTKQMEFTFYAITRRGNWPFCFKGTLLDDAEETVWLILELWLKLWGKGDGSIGLAAEDWLLVSVGGNR